MKFTKKLMSIFLLLILIQSCFVTNTIKRTNTLQKVVRGKSDIKVYNLPIEYAFSVYYNETKKWNQKLDLKRKVITVNNLTQIGGPNKCTAIIKFNLDSLPQQFLDDPDKIQECFLKIQASTVGDKGLVNMAATLIDESYNVDSLSWNNRPKLNSKFFLTMQNDGQNGNSITKNFRLQLIEMIKSKKNNGIMLIPQNNTDIKNSSVIDHLFTKENNGVFAIIPINNIYLTVY